MQALLPRPQPEHLQVSEAWLQELPHGVHEQTWVRVPGDIQ